MFPDAVDTITGAMHEVHAKPDEIAAVHEALTTIMKTLDGDNFEYMATIQRESFGDNASATTLAYHHGLAQQVMNETLEGIKSDITAFARNLKRAHEILDDVDTAAGTEISKRQALVEAFDGLNHHSHEAHNHQQARNHQHNPWPTQPPPTSGGPSGEAR